MLFVGEIWKTLGLWTWKAVEHFKQGLMGHAGRIMEDSRDEGDVDYTQTWLKRFGQGGENIISWML